ncbi:Mitochondrial ATPase complex subunit atp10 [Mitosporidium daphniae]
MGGLLARIKRLLINPEVFRRNSEIIKEYSNTFASQLRQFERAKGKLFQASIFASAEDAPLMPRIRAIALDRSSFVLPDECHRRKATLVAISFSAMGSNHVDSFVNPFVATKRQSCVACYQVRVVENTLYALLWPLIWLSTMDIPKPRRAFVTNYFGGMQSQAHQLGVRNRIPGYVFLVDSEGKIRWKATGEATRAEIEQMFTVCDGLTANRPENLET